MKRITLIFLFASFQMFAQTPKIGIDEQCHVENTKMLIEVLEKTIGEKKIKKIIDKKKSILYDYKINSIYPVFKLNIRFNQDSSVDEMEFVRNTDKQLTKKQMKQIIRYINKNKILFNICWSDLFKVNHEFSEEFKKELTALFLEDIGKHYTMVIFFPGKITEDFYNKYVEDK
ncbi:hypothetical protein K5I29_11620 [Flavobacterium agricola]|uniref:DUF4476 domain-containing protein n=1 Tax=Flavobacterium agricola TaxID=2870839 RepID=A0ABY6LZW0_9FLAO|nr:hypothetical protein [Flavobacterium agricola]UYW01107.1 hypothetical protein K5I29_11620 [Flavobacterium agricola]